MDNLLKDKSECQKLFVRRLRRLRRLRRDIQVTNRIGLAAYERPYSAPQTSVSDFEFLIIVIQSGGS